MSLRKRDRPLTQSDKDAFFAPLAVGGHLAYRLTMLWTHKRRAETRTLTDYAYAVCTFEASLIACRVLLEFLGLGLDRSDPPNLAEQPEYFTYRGKTDEVKVTDLGGSFASLSRIPADEQTILAKVYYMAHKATAHLTHGAPFMESAALVHQAVPIIDRLLDENLFNVVGQKPVY